MIHPPHEIERFAPGSFEAREHYYERVLNAQLHPLVRSFMNLGNARIASRYAHLHPEATRADISAMLGATPSHFRWAGADLFLATSAERQRQMMVVETNSCPSGQKSMPPLNEADEMAGYRALLERSFLPSVSERRKLPRGALGVIYDKNPMEARGYAATLAELTGEEVLLVPCFADQTNPLSVDDGVLVAETSAGSVPLRAAVRYVTQRPWNRLPPITRTHMNNAVLACLAGGRNKALAAKAYDIFNADHEEAGLTIRTPETIWDVARSEVPLWVRRMGGVCVVKNPYSNAGQGVYTITNELELEHFMQSEQRYDRFIVQALIGNARWSSRSRAGQLYHVGTVPNRKGQIFAADLRVMVGAGTDGFFPVALYARRARVPLDADPPDGVRSWKMLGTNLSVRRGDGWATETERLLLVDQRDFNRLGLGLDDLIEAYLQTVMAVTAIDNMGQRLLTRKRVFRKRFFRQVTCDAALCDELL